MIRQEPDPTAFQNPDPTKLPESGSTTVVTTLINFMKINRITRKA